MKMTLALLSIIGLGVGIGFASAEEGPGDPRPREIVAHFWNLKRGDDLSFPDAVAYVDTDALQVPGNLPEVLSPERRPDVFEEAGRHHGVVLPWHIPVVLKQYRDLAGRDPFPVQLTRVLVLAPRDCAAGDLIPPLGCEVKEVSPAAAQLKDMLWWRPDPAQYTVILVDLSVIKRHFLAVPPAA